MTKLDEASGPIRALIKRTETGRTKAQEQYETIIAHKESELPKPITQMTVDEIIATGPKWRAQFGTASAAVGAYQIITPTLKELKQALGLKGTERFTPVLQERMGMYLLNEKRGFGKFLAGKMSADNFMIALAKEWASFPRPDTGKSHYDGDRAGNSALIKVGVVRKTLAECLAIYNSAGPIAKPTTKVSEEVEPEDFQVPESDLDTDQGTIDPSAPARVGPLRRIFKKLVGGLVGKTAVQYIIAGLGTTVGAFLIGWGLVDEATWADILRWLEANLAEGIAVLIGGGSIAAAIAAMNKGTKEAAKDKVVVAGKRVEAKTPRARTILRDMLDRIAEVDDEE